MAFIYQFPLSVLSQHDTGHMIFFRDPSADHKVIVLQILNLQPLPRPLPLKILAFFPLCHNPFQALLLGQGK